MLGTGRVNKVFSPGIITNVYVKKIVTNMKVAFTNVPLDIIQLVLFKSGQNLSYLHFALHLFVSLIQLKCNLYLIHLSPNGDYH